MNDIEKKTKELVYQFRWVIGIALWMVFTILQIHGSSIGIYSAFMHTPELDTAIWGINRMERFDEWLNVTPFAFAQYIPGNDGAFSVFNNAIRSVPTDMFAVIGSPCWSIGTLFRPFLWGYLFFSPSVGLAYFWTGRLIVLFLITFDASLLWTRNNRFLSWLFALMVTLSPAVQWWFAANSFVEMLIAAQAIAILLKKYIVCQQPYKKYALASGMTYFCIMYIVTLYPAWQIPFAYIFLAFYVWIIIQGKKYYSWHKSEIFCGIGLLLIVIAILAHIIYISQEAISLVRESVYPGHRFITGGGLAWDWLFNSSLGLFMPFSQFIRPQFSFNMTAFFDLSPLGIILSLYYLGYKRNRDLLLELLIGIDVIFIVFCMVPWPPWLCKVTLLYAVPEGRLIIPISFINLCLIVRILSIGPRMEKVVTWIISLICAGTSAISVFHYCPDAYTLYNGGILIMVMGIGCLCVCRYRRHLGPLVLGLCLVIGGMVNPIARGASSIYGTALSKDIEQIVRSSQGKWLVVGKQVYMNNYPIIFGAPTVNCFNSYPAWPVWKKLENSAALYDVFNRSAHVHVSEIIEGETVTSSPHGDLIEMKMNREDLRRLDIHYILADEKNMEQFDTQSMIFICCKQDNGYYIYEVQYL